MTHADAGPSSLGRKDNAAPAKAGGEFHIPSLDGIRAVSFMLVFVAHAGLGHMIPGGFGVTIFFFLSGYLITTLMRLERDRTGHNSLRDFYLRRAFRILPPFYTVLTIAIVVTALGLMPEGLSWGSVLAQLGHITNYWFIFKDKHGFPGGTVVYWSLAVEEHFYLVFPGVFIALKRWFPARAGLQAGVLLALCALVLAWRFALVLLFDVADPDRTALATDTRIDSILFGCVLALLGNPMLDPWRGSRALWTRVLLPLGVLLLAFSLAFRAPWFRETLRYSLQGIALVPLFVVAIRYPDWLPMRLLNQKTMRWFGLLSYSLYLSHQVLLLLLQGQLPNMPLVTAVLSFALSTLLAWAIHVWVEKPSARARKAWVTTTWLKPVAQ